MGQLRKRTDFRYPIEEQKAVVEVKLPLIKDVFDDWDPSPATIRDIDDDLEEYLISCVQEIGAKKLGKVRFFFDKEPSSTEIKAFTQAFSDFFYVQENKEMVNVKTMLKLGFKSLLLGLGFLVFAIFISQLIHSKSPVFWEAVLKEGLLLLGWVSMWKPINIFLYEWWPYLDRVKIYRCLGQVELEVKDFKVLQGVGIESTQLDEKNVENFDICYP